MKKKIVWVAISELDRIGPVDNRPSTAIYIYIFFFFYMTPDT